MTLFDGIQMVTLALALGFFAYTLRPRKTSLDRLLRESVIVTLKSGAAFQGVLYEHDARSWTLRQAFALAAGENSTNLPIDGEVVLFVADIAYAQRP